jgi:DNA helicase IV
VLDAAISIFRHDRAARLLPEPSHEEMVDIRRGVRRTREFRAALERMWPILSPHELLNDLFGIPALARSAVRGHDRVDATLLVRERAPRPESARWTVEDVPLLDEAADQLGSWTDATDRLTRRRRAADRRREVGYARSVLGSLDLAIDINAEHFADRFADQLGGKDVAHAARDRTWKFGHVIVDEAQELSPMAWRMVYRRAPSRSMTMVGDLAQASAPWAPSSWSSVLEPFARDRWRLVELSTNYRTPSEIMDVANAVLAIAAPGARPTTAIRSSGRPPLRRRVVPGTLALSVADAAKRVLEDVDEGRMAVIAPPRVTSLLEVALVDRLGSEFDPSNPLGARAALLAVNEAKGLEFDTVLLVEPGEIARHRARGQNDLYVALTRATQRLLVIHEAPLTPELEAHITPLAQ